VNNGWIQADRGRGVMLQLKVFPRRTRATPNDPGVYIGEPDLFTPEAAEIHISVTFSWDVPRAEQLAEIWRERGNVSMGGPAMGTQGGDFEPGKYLKRGYVITSRGCPNKCWFCEVWRRDGDIRELPITGGWNVLDDNLLACSEGHIRAVFAMLKRQPQRAEFTGGLEAARLEDWHIDLLLDLRPKQMFFAYDTDDDYEPLLSAGQRLIEAGFTRASHKLRCYVLIGYPGDTRGAAERRLMQTIEAGFMPMAMLWRGKNNKPQLEWRRFQRTWARPTIVAASDRQIAETGQDNRAGLFNV